MKQASARLQALVQTQSPRTESIQPPGKEPALAASLQQLFDMGVLASRLLIKSTHWLRSAKIPQSNQGPYDSKHMLYQLSYSWLAKKNSHMPPNHVPKAVDILGVSCETANGSNLDVEVNKGGCVGVCVKLKQRDKSMPKLEGKNLQKASLSLRLSKKHQWSSGRIHH